MTGSSSPEITHPFCDTTTRILLASISLAIPFIFYAPLTDPFQLPKQVLFRFGVLLLLGIGLARAVSTGTLRLGPRTLGLPFLLLAFITFLSIFPASNAHEAFSLACDLLLGGLAVSLMLPALADRMRLVAAALGVAGAGVALLGCLQFIAGPGAVHLPPTMGGSLVGDVTTAAAAVSSLLPLLLALAASAKGACRWAWGVGAGLAAGFVTLARFPGGWIAAGTGLLILAASEFRRRNVPSSSREGVFHRWKVTASAALLALILTLCGVSWAGIDLISAPPSLKVAEFQGGEMQLATWSATVRLILTHPLGVGAGNWRNAFPSRAGSGEGGNPLSPARLPSSAGSEYLEVASELGLAGIVFFVWFLERLMILGWKRAGAVEGGIVEGAFAGIGGLAAGGLVSSPLREQPAAWFALALMALVLAQDRPSGEGNPEEVPWRLDLPPGRRRWIGGTAALAFLAILGLSAWDAYRTLSSSAYLHRGEQSFLRADYAAALPALIRAAEILPSSYPARYMTGTCAFAAGRYELAETELRQALQVSPYEAGALVALGSTLKARGSLTDAVAVCEKAAALWPENAELLLRLGEARQAAGDLSGAREAYESAAMKNPYSVRGQSLLASALEKEGKMGQALGAYRKVAELDPYSVEGAYQLGAAYVRQGQYEEAVRTLSQALALSPEDVRSLLLYGRALAGLQNYCDAVTILQKARGSEKDPARRAGIEEAIAGLSPRCVHPSKTGR